MSPHQLTKRFIVEAFFNHNTDQNKQDSNILECLESANKIKRNRKK